MSPRPPKTERAEQRSHRVLAIGRRRGQSRGLAPIGCGDRSQRGTGSGVGDVDTASEDGIDRNIRYRHKAVAASWSTESGQWSVEAERCSTLGNRFGACARAKQFGLNSISR